MSKLINKYDQDDAYINGEYDEIEDITLWEDIISDANKVLNKKQFVQVEGSMGLWNGSVDIFQIIEENNLQDIISNYINPDRLEVEVYNDKVILRNIHHDGTNYYELIPFDFNDFTIRELKEFFDEYDIEDFNKEDYKYSFSHALKKDLIDFVQFNELYKNN